jgi:hypothetical protein
VQSLELTDKLGNVINVTAAWAGAAPATALSERPARLAAATSARRGEGRLVREKCKCIEKPFLPSCLPGYGAGLDLVQDQY